MNVAGLEGAAAHHAVLGGRRRRLDRRRGDVHRDRLGLAHGDGYDRSGGHRGGGLIDGWSRRFWRDRSRNVDRGGLLFCRCGCLLRGLRGRLGRLRRLHLFWLLGPDQPVSLRPPAHSIGLRLFDARRVTLHSDTERDSEVERLLVGHPELFGQLVEADLCGQVAFSLSDGDEDQFTCAPADAAVERGASFSHVRTDFQWSCEDRLQPSVSLWTEGTAQRPPECIPLRRLGQASGAFRAQPRPPSGERASHNELTVGVRDNPDQVV